MSMTLITSLSRNYLAMLCGAALLFLSVSINAQTWSLRGGYGGTNADKSTAVCTDATGNVYITGSYAASAATFGSTTLPLIGANDGFVAKFNAAGVPQWAISFGGTSNDFGLGIVTDGLSVYVVGTFTTAMTVNGAGPYISGGGTDGVVIKLNASTGATAWVKTFGGNSTENAQSICLDPSGNVYVSGSFFSQSPNNFGTFSKTPTGSLGSDLYVLQMDAAGTITWVSTGGNSGGNDNTVTSSLCYVPSLSELVMVGGSNNAGPTTCFYGTVSLATSAGNDLILLEINASTGGFISGKIAGGAGNEDGVAACYDSYTGNVILAGYFNSGTITFGSTTLSNSNTGTDDILYASYNVSTNAFAWANSAGSASVGSDRPRGIFSNGSGSAIIAGLFAVGTASFPTASGPLTLTNGRTNGGAPFLAAINTITGNASWTRAGTVDNTTNSDNAFNAVAISASGDVWATGAYTSNLTLSPLAALPSASGITVDILIAKLTLPLSATQSQVNLVCNGVCNGSASVVASGGTGPYTYSWSPSGGSAATGALLCATTYTVTITDAALTSITKTFTLTQPSALTATTSKTDVLCNGASSGSASVNVSGGTPAYTYSWSPLGGTAATATNLTAGNYTCTITDNSLCSITKTFTIAQPASTPGSNSYSLPTSNQSVIKNVSNANYVTGTCQLVSSVVASGGSPISGSVTNKVWVEGSVPMQNGIPYVQRHYEITPAAGASTATGTVTLYFTQAEFDNYNADAGSFINLPTGPTDNAGKSSLRIGKYSGISGNGTGLPASYSSSTTVIDPVDSDIIWNAVSNTWEVKFAVTGFSGFIVQTNLFTLPVTWVSFTVKRQGQSALLNWSTATEQNTKEFVVQHSTDRMSWNAAGIVAAAGNSNSLHNYSFIHNNTIKGYNYYRIMQTDLDGKSGYSDVGVLNLTEDHAAFTIAGNKISNGVLQIQVYKTTVISFYEVNGKQLWIKKFTPGLQSMDVSNYAKGVYLLNANEKVQKIFIE